jgi:hypothetical protein
VPSTTPAKEPTAEAAEEAPQLPQLAAGVSGARGVAYSSPNMFGDAFGTQPTHIVVQLPTIPGINQNISVAHLPVGANAVGFLAQAPANSSLKNFRPTQAVGTGGFTQTFGPGMVFTSLGSFPGFPPTIPVSQNLAETQALAQFVPGAFGKGGTLAFVSGTATKIDYPLYSIDTLYNYFRAPVPQSIVLDIASPANGGVVGRTKISDDNIALRHSVWYARGTPKERRSG